MSPSLVLADCPECRGIQTVVLGSCRACFAEFGHREELEPESNEGDDLSDRPLARKPILPQRPKGGFDGINEVPGVWGKVSVRGT
jgi:hypothetical protein